jgi:serine/threonine protein kinase
MSTHLKYNRIYNQSKNFNKSKYLDFVKIGEGSFGVVVRARDTETNTTIVIKTIIKPSKTLSESTRKHREDDILSEVEALSTLHATCDQHILCAIEFAEDEDHFYIITEYLGNYMTLLEWSASRGSLSHDKLLHIIDNLIDGLRTIHNFDIAHRDIKMENIMINPNTLDVKYIDFGLSCVSNKCTKRRVGSPLYAAPELFADELSTPDTMNLWFRADIWSLGMVILEIIPPLKLSFIEFISTVEGYDLTSEDCYKNLFLLDKILHTIGITARHLRLYFSAFSITDSMQTFIHDRVLPMLGGDPNTRTLRGTPP